MSCEMVAYKMISVIARFKLAMQYNTLYKNTQFLDTLVGQEGLGRGELELMPYIYNCNWGISFILTYLHIYVHYLFLDVEL